MSAGRKTDWLHVLLRFSAIRVKMASQRSEKLIRAPPRLSAVSPRLPSKQCQCLVEHRSFPTLERGMSAMIP